MELNKVLLLLSALFISVHLEFILGIKLEYVFVFIFSALYIIKKYISLEKSEQSESKDRSYLLLIFLLVALFSSFNSYYLEPNVILRGTVLNSAPFRSLFRVMLLTVFILFFFFIKELITDRNKFLFAIKAHTNIVTMISILGLTSFLFNFFNLPLKDNLEFLLIRHDITRIRSTMLEPGILGTYILTSLPLLISIALLKKFDKKYLIFSILIQTTTLFLTFSRSAWLASIVIILMFSIYIFKNKIINFSKHKIILVLFLVLFFLIMFTPNKISQTAQSIYEYNVVESFKEDSFKSASTRVRMLSFSYALEVFRTRPISGIGYENYAFYTANKPNYWLYGNDMTFPEVNNLPIKFLTEFGIIGFIICIWIYLTTLRLLIRRIKFARSSFEMNLGFGFLTSFIGISIQYMFYSSLNHAFLWFFLALLFRFFDEDLIPDEIND